MDSAALRELVRDYQLGLRDDIEVLESHFNHVWYFIDGDGYELTLMYGKGIYAILYHHRRLRQVVIDFLSEFKICYSNLKDSNSSIFDLAKSFKSFKYGLFFKVTIDM